MNTFSSSVRHWIRGLLLTLAAASLHPLCAAASAAADCEAAASPSCFFSITPAALGGAFHYYASLPPGKGTPTSVIVAMHGHPRDANRTFDATLLAVKQAGRLPPTLVIAPLFQVDEAGAAKCRSPGVPVAEAGDLTWTCSSWMEGELASNGAHPTSFAAMDALLAELVRQWPSLRTVTVAGFSAGGQMVQHYIGFEAAALPSRVALRFVVADPGSWLYFDAAEEWPAPQALSEACPTLRRWKYGVEELPVTLGRSAAGARARYASADVSYLEGELDADAGPHTAHGALDKSCAAMAQGPYRLQRGQAYAEYDRQRLAPSRQRRVVVVPGCAHDVSCVFPSPAARAALLGPTR
jgi:hypothetical protein